MMVDREGAGADVEPFELQWLLRSLGQAVEARMRRALVAERLSLMQFVVLDRVRRGESTCTSLARSLRHDGGAMTRLVRRLEVDGLVIAIRDREDRRRRTLALTAEGRAAADRGLQLVRQGLAASRSDRRSEDLSDLVALLPRLVRGLETHLA